MKKRHVIFYKVARILVMIFTKIRFGYRFQVAKDLPENYIVISNHATDYDVLFVAMSFRKMMYFVGSSHISRWGFASKLLEFCFAPIMRYKGASAASAIKEMSKKARKGANVCLFAEGVRTWDGITCPIAPSTAKLIKSLGCGLVTYKITGGYFVSPMWAGATVRKGSLQGAPVRILTKEQLQEMSNEEVYELLKNDLYEDAYERQMASPQKYKGKNLAEGMENLLFVCPECGARDSFESVNDTVSCKKCGLSFHYDEYGMLKDAPFETLRDFAAWQNKKVEEHVAEDAVYTAEHAILSVLKQQEETLLTEGPVTFSKKSVTCGDVSIPMESITDFAMHGRRAVVFTADKTYYEMIPSKGSNSLKFLLYFNEYRKAGK